MTTDENRWPAPAPQTEVELHGGTSNRGLVVRIGDTVHRPQSAGSAGVHALLLHLEAVGFDGAPRYLGQDDQGREVLSYMPGQAATVPYPPWALTDDALASVADLLRRYHTAVSSFDPSTHEWPTRVPVEYREDLVSHNDPNLDNVIFRDGQACALIDFDLASPGSRVWDVALAARLWVPLRDPSDVPDGRSQRPYQRLRLFADAYGVERRDRARLAAAAARSHTWCYDIIRNGAGEGIPGYERYWTASARRRDERGRQWLAVHLPDLREALI